MKTDSLPGLNLGKDLETSTDPIQDVIDNYNTAPTVSIHTDPWDQRPGQTPGSLYKRISTVSSARVLGMCYSLQLTDRFNGSLLRYISLQTTTNPQVITY